jgi:Cu(I)/Ag(I) efflux system membrane fusion protein
MSTKASRVAAIAVGALLVAAVAGTAGYWVGHTPSSPAVAERKVLYWYDPMSPEQKFAKPGKSPFMDMPLVPRYADTAADGAKPGVQLDPVARQNLGVRLARVERTPVVDQQSVTGTIGYNQRDVAVIQARAAGFVERGYGRAPGDVLAAGAPLADLLVPAWDGALAEYFGVRRLGDAALTAAARQRLRLLGLSDAAIARADASGQARAMTTITTPIGGALQTLDVRPGMTVAAGQTLAQVNGLGRVWLDAAVPEAMAAHLAVGQHARAELTAFPNEPFTGRIAAILPAAQPDSRTLTVRIELPNPGGRLRPDRAVRSGDPHRHAHRRDGRGRAWQLPPCRGARRPRGRRAHDDRSGSDRR